MTDILSRIIVLVAFNTNISPAAITSDTDFESLGFDSLSVSEMAVAIKREFGVDVHEDDLMRCPTVGEMANAVAMLTGNA